MKNSFLGFLAVAFVFATSTSGLSAQEFDSVTFSGVKPLAGGVIESHNLSTSDILESIVFSGSITEVNTATFASEILFDYSGSGLSDSGLQFSTVTGFTDTLVFEGVIDVAATAVNAGDSWMYTFFESFDDGSDGLADASVDVTFSYRSSDVSAQTSGLGTHTLDDGFYDRAAGGDADHPWAEVAFQVDADGVYQIDAVWDGFDGYLYLFDETFTGDDSGNIAFDDDFGGTGASQIPGVSLMAGTTYYAVMTTFGGQAGISTLTGDLSVTSSVGNSAFIVAIPEPSSAIMFAMTGLGLFVRRRRAS